MISIDNINKICVDKGMTKMSISTYPTWIDKERQEGIEIKGGKIIPFWVISGNKNYDQPTGNKILKTIALINESNDVSEPKEEKNVPYAGRGRPEDKPEKSLLEKIDLPELKNAFVNTLPAVFNGERIIAFQDMDTLKKEYPSTISRMLLFQKTPKALIKTKNGRGGKQSYVEGHVMKMEAWIAFLGQVSSKIDGFFEDDKGVTCYGSITVPVDGQMITVSSVGIDLQEYTKDEKKPVFTLHEMRKNACTDMKKKILADMGFNRDVYSGEV